MPCYEPPIVERYEAYLKIPKDVEIDLRFQARQLIQYVGDILQNALIRPEERCTLSETFLFGALTDAYQKGHSDAKN